jgi:hypothetical protein
MTEYYAKDEYQRFKIACTLNKEELLDKIIDILDGDYQNFEESVGLDRYHIIEAFKKINGREYHLEVTDEVSDSDPFYTRLTGKEDPAVRGNKK